MHVAGRGSGWRRRIRQKIASRVDQGLYRKHRVFDRNIEGLHRCFASNDYLGMRFHPEVIAAMGEGAQRFECRVWVCTLMSGFSRPHQHHTT